MIVLYNVHKLAIFKTVVVYYYYPFLTTSVKPIDQVFSFSNKYVTILLKIRECSKCKSIKVNSVTMTIII